MSPLNQKTIPRRTTPALIALSLALLVCVEARPSEPRYPVALMNWMVEGTFHALIVDKSTQRLSVWRITDGEPVMIDSYRCSTGEKRGDKWIRGDMKTPEGVYFFCSVIDGDTLPEKYGLWAFTTDYPNFVDRRRGKSGDGIWLHGRDKPLALKPDSNGCIALENRDLIKVSRFIRLQSTPLIVVKKMRMAPRSRIIEQERALRDFVESWRRAWESKDLEAYMAHYSRNFQSCWLDYSRWKEKKRILNRRYSKIRVKLGKVYLYRQNGLVTSIFTQAYRSDGFQATGIKVLYIRDKPTYRVYAEDFHQPTDDPFPVRTLLAKVGVTDIPEVDEKRDFKIRLVSTDEPERLAGGDIESPRPVAPARGVVLERLRGTPATKISTVQLERNTLFCDGQTPARTVVAMLMPQDNDTAGCSVELTGSPRRTARILPAPEKARRAEASVGEQDQRGSADVKEWATIAAAPAVSEFEFDDRGGKPAESVHEKDSSDRSSAETKADREKAVLWFLRNWKAAWEQKDLDSYTKMYHPDFRVGKLSRKKLRRAKRSFFSKYDTIRVELEQVEIKEVKGRVHVKFRQSFRGDDYRDKGWKRMVLAGSKDKGFRILSEVWSPR
jgi:murein L,D-transpeptidase YafK